MLGLASCTSPLYKAEPAVFQGRPRLAIVAFDAHDWSVGTRSAADRSRSVDAAHQAFLAELTRADLQARDMPVAAPCEGDLGISGEPDSGRGASDRRKRACRSSRRGAPPARHPRRQLLVSRRIAAPTQFPRHSTGHAVRPRLRRAGQTGMGGPAGPLPPFHPQQRHIPAKLRPRRAGGGAPGRRPTCCPYDRRTSP